MIETSGQNRNPYQQPSSASSSPNNNIVRNQKQDRSHYAYDTMASGSGAAPEGLSQAGSSPSQQPNQSPTQASHEPEEEQDPKKIIFANMKLFKATIARLQKVRFARVWAPPNMEAGLAYNLKEESPAPEYISMGTKIDVDWRVREDIAVPSTCLRILGRDLIRLSSSKKKIKAHASAITRFTLNRGFHLACTIIEQAMKSDAFYDTMRQKSESQRIIAISKLIEPKHIFYLYSSQFDAVCFHFIFHEGVRQIAEEEVLRNDLRKLLTYYTAQIVYDYLRYCIKAEEGKEKNPIEKGGAGRAAVRANYLRTPYHGPAKNVFKSLRSLPASFYMDEDSE
ncbi:hypothetical protein V490_03818 [Pseudogymnoascus sp. VKM F-3557]|nr:hypothetical protein V490_03818 [Pseudogymnoascus sp. VKM F-3557]